MTKILDIQQSIIAANGNISLAKELFSMLLDDLDLRFQQIESSFQSQNMTDLEHHVHKLYGATAYCIVPKLRESVKELEHALAQNKYSHLTELVAVILTNIKQLMNDGPGFITEEWFATP